MKKVVKVVVVEFFEFVESCSYLDDAETWFLCAGNALLKLRQRIVSDPFGSLSNWIDDEVSLDACNWFGVECSDGKVVAL